MKHHMSKADQNWLNQFNEDLVTAPPLSPPDHFLANNISVTLAIPDREWTILDDDLFFLKDRIIKEGNGAGKQGGIGSCKGVIHAEPEMLLGW